MTKKPILVLFPIFLVYLYVYNALLLILSSQSISKLQYFLYNSIYGNRVIPFKQHFLCLPGFRSF